MAEVANACWLKKLGDDQYKETTGKYFRPENCIKVVVPKVNEEIWGKLSRNAKSRDVKFSRLQSNVTKAGCVVLNTAESLLNLSAKADKNLAGELHKLLVQATDAIQLRDCSASERRHQTSTKQGVWRPLLGQCAGDRVVVWR